MLSWFLIPTLIPMKQWDIVTPLGVWWNLVNALKSRRRAPESVDLDPPETLRNLHLGWDGRIRFKELSP